MTVTTAFGGRFTPDRELIADGGRWLYTATDLTTGGRVVLEVLRPEACDPSPVARSQFERTMRAVADLDHDAIAAVVGAGYDHGSYFVASEPVADASLAVTSIEPAAVPVLALDLVDALMVAHDSGVTHGALTSASVLVGDDDQFVITGFGSHAAQPAEDASSATATRAADLRAVAAIVHAALGEAPDDPRLADVVRRLSTAGETGGYQDAREARGDLDQLVQASETGPHPAVHDAEPDPTGGTAAAPRAGAVAALPRSARLVLGALCLGVVVSLGVLGAGRLGFWAPDPPATAVPDVTGLNQQDATDRLAAAGLRPRFQNQASAEVTQGLVLDQAPAAGTTSREGDRVTVVVSEGGADVVVPSVVGRLLADAGAILGGEGLLVEVRPTPGSTAEPGTVFRQAPVAETPARQGDRVVLFVAASR